MNIGERITHIRNVLNVKQGEMAKRINIKQGSLSDIERGKVSTVTDRVINDICREYGINEEWLRSGEGTMAKVENIEITDLLANKSDIDDIDKKIIIEYLKLNAKQRKAIKDFIGKISIGDK